MTIPPENPNLEVLVGGIWAIESIVQTPEVMLEDWSCFEVQLPGLPGRSRHLAGSKMRNWHGQVSSPISFVDPATRRCTTRSGRAYELGERNGLTLNGEYVWHQWVRINQASRIVDVTNEVIKMLSGHL